MGMSGLGRERSEEYSNEAEPNASRITKHLTYWQAVAQQHHLPTLLVIGLQESGRKDLTWSGHLIYRVSELPPAG